MGGLAGAAPPPSCRALDREVRSRRPPTRPDRGLAVSGDEFDFVDGLPGFGLAGAGALGLLWVLGPSARAFGKNLGRWTDYQTDNLFRLSAKVKERLGDQPPSDEGSVHPRVAKEILDAAAWIDDDLHQEYLAGLIVEARSQDGKDDGQILYTRIVAGMTASMVRVHHALYSAYLGTKHTAAVGKSFVHEKDWLHLSVIATNQSWSLCASNGRPDRGISDLVTATHGLHAAGLIKGSAFPDQGADRARYQLVPTLLGAQIFGNAMFTPTVGADSIRLPMEELRAEYPKARFVTAPVEYPPLVDVAIQALT